MPAWYAGTQAARLVISGPNAWIASESGTRRMTAPAPGAALSARRPGPRPPGAARPPAPPARPYRPGRPGPGPPRCWSSPAGPGRRGVLRALGHRRVLPGGQPPLPAAFNQDVHGHFRKPQRLVGPQIISADMSDHDTWHGSDQLHDLVPGGRGHPGGHQPAVRGVERLEARQRAAVRVAPQDIRRELPVVDIAGATVDANLESRDELINRADCRSPRCGIVEQRTALPVQRSRAQAGSTQSRRPASELVEHPPAGRGLKDRGSRRPAT